jgi:hypothetical protein
MKTARPILANLLAIALCAGAAHAQAPQDETARLAGLQAGFAPVDLDADTSALPPNERLALGKLVEAAELMDPIFMQQIWSGNTSTLLRLLKDRSPLGQARLRSFPTEKGPWDRQDGNKSFIAGAPPKPAQGDFYPADASKDEVEKWIASLPAQSKAQATGFFSVVRRFPGGALKTVPYSVQYQNQLQTAAGLLKDAAALTAQPALRTYLEKRAAAFADDDYYASDVAWMELDASIEPTIGPYETYEDEWFGAKAAFEAFICLRDEAETSKLQRFSGELQWLEDRLPIEKKWRNPKLGAMSPIRVVNEVFASGDAAHGVTTAAFNLPNDERVTREKGSKRTMLRNVQQAKFRTVLLPIASRALPEADRSSVDFDAFFTHILMHELMHGLGPHDVPGADGKSTTPVRILLKETASALEEAKADVSGLWALQRLIDKGVLDQSLEKTLYVTYLASSFRTLRFGTAEAHGKGMALQVNYILDQGGFKVGADGAFSVDARRIKGAVEGLTRDIMTIQAKGDYAAAKSLLGRLGVVRPQVQAVLDRLTDIPVDIEPRFVAAQRLAGESPGD